MQTSSKVRRGVLQALAAVAATLAMGGALAQPYPNKPIRLVVGFAPGGAADVVTRIIAKGLATELNQQVIVDNKAGADGIIAATEVMRAPADGYTFLLGTNTAMVAVPSLRPNPPYDPFKAFTPISSAGEFSMFLAVSPKLPSGNLAEFLEHVAANPGKYNSASSNSAAELAMLQLLGTKHAKVVNARYKGDATAMTDLVSGNIHMMFSTGTLTPMFAKEGKIKALTAQGKLQGVQLRFHPNSRLAERQVFNSGKPIEPAERYARDGRPLGADGKPLSRWRNWWRAVLGPPGASG